MFDEILPFDAPFERYHRRAKELLDAARQGEASARKFLENYGARCTESDAPMELEGALHALACAHGFADAAALEFHASAACDPGTSEHRFEAAVEAVIGGDLLRLDVLLRADSELVCMRSSRRSPGAAHPHRATLLHYLAANGIEDFRQRSPENAVAISARLFAAGAEVDALADCYDGSHTALSLLVSSTPPAEAGVQVPLVHALIDAGAAIEGVGVGAWVSPLRTALAFGFVPAAEALANRGARVDALDVAAGLGRIESVRALLDSAHPPERHAALALSAQLGHAAILQLLLDAGEDPDRHNPQSLHAHATPLHQAALHGHLEVVRLLVSRGARIDRRDRIFDATPLDWAIHGQRHEVAAFLRSIRGQAPH